MRLVALLPGPDGGAGGGQAAGSDRDRLAGGVGGSGVVVGDPDRPAVAGRRAGDGDVAAEADQDADVEVGGDPGRAPVGGPGFGGGAEIELGAVVEPDVPGDRVEPHVAPARDRIGSAGTGLDWSC